MKKILLLLLIITAFVLPSFSNGSADGDVIMLAVTGPYSGDLAPYGVPTSEAAKIIVDKVNEAGGVQGRQIKLIVEDDICDPNQATLVANKLIAKNVVAVIGPVCSGAAASAMDTYLSENIPVISPSATNPNLTLDYANFFRTIAGDDKQGVRQADFLVKTLKSKKIAVIHDQQDYGKGLADGTKENLEKLGAEITLYEGVTAGAVDYSAIVSKIINAKVDAFVYGGYDADGSKLIGQLRAKSFAGNIVVGDGFKGEQFLKLAGDSAEGVFATGPKDYTETEAYKNAVAEYKAMNNGNTPGTFYAEGYAATMILIELLKEVNLSDTKTTRQEITDMLLSGKSFDTAVGTISFDKNGNSVGTGFNVYQVSNGAFITIE